MAAHVSIILCHYSKIDDFGERAAGPNPPSRSDLVKKCIQSIKQTVDYPAELIVMDNGGEPDDTDYFLNELRAGSINELVRYKDNVHFAFAWNQGAKIATGEYLCFVCNDIEFHPKWLSSCVEILEKYADRKFISTPFLTYDKRRYTVETTPEGYRVNLRSGSNCMLMRRETFYDIGEFLHHRIAGTIWFNKMYKMGYRTVAPPQDLALDMGWRKGVNFRIPIKVQKKLLDGSLVDFTEPSQK